MNQETEIYERTWRIADELAQGIMIGLSNRGWDAEDIQSLNSFLCTLMRRNKTVAAYLLVSSIIFDRIFENDFVILSALADHSLIDVFMDVFTDVIDDVVSELVDDEQDETEEENTDDGE